MTPYIPDQAKAPLRVSFHPGLLAENAGELNYVLTTVIIDYMLARGLSYQHINDVDGALSACSKEFYRRVAVPYEEHKIKVNGDVYQSLLERFND
jgi:hypothetical protein